MNEKLLMQIGLIDQITKPLQGITKEIQGAMGTAEKGMEQAAKGGVGLVATGFAIQNALMPAIEMDRGLSELKALGVIQKDLNALEKAAYEFSGAYGKTAQEFLSHSALMRDVYGDVSGDVLVNITRNSSALAIAMKTDAQTVSKFMKTVYGNYKADADAMGVDKFTAQVAGMVGKAKEVYGINFDTMEGAVDGMHSLTSTLGVSFDEQLTVLGMLQKSMGEGDAVTQYTNYLEGAITAQGKLGVSFTDSQGKLLPMMQVLENIKPLIQGMSGIEARYLLDEAGLGDGSLMLINLIENMGDFEAGLKSINGVKDMSNVENMAAAMTDQSQRLEASWFAIRAAVFGMVLPAFNAVAGNIADNLTWLTSLTSEYPLLTEYLGYAAIGALSLGGVVASLSLVMGIAKMMSGGWAVTMLGLSSSLKVLGAATQMLTLKTWLLNAAFWANPITWIVAGIIAAAAAIWVFKDYIGAFLDGFISGFIEASGVATLFEPLILAFKLIGSAIGWVFDWVVKLLTPIDAASESLSSFASAGQMVGFIIGTVFQGILMPIKLVMMALEQFLQLINKIPGIDINFDLGVSDLKDIPEVSGTLSNSIDVANADTSVIDYKNPQNAPALNPAMVQNLNSTQSRQTVNSKNYGDVYITTDKAFTPDQLEEWNELNAG